MPLVPPVIIAVRPFNNWFGDKDVTSTLIIGANCRRIPLIILFYPSNHFSIPFNSLISTFNDCSRLRAMILCTLS